MELTALTTVLREAWLSSLSTSQANYSTDPLLGLLYHQTYNFVQISIVSSQMSKVRCYLQTVAAHYASTLLTSVLCSAVLCCVVRADMQVLIDNVVHTLVDEEKALTPVPPAASVVH